MSSVANGNLFVFEIYNKDFSEYSTGKKNLHTYYWEQLFSSENKENGFVIELNGGAELFYRDQSLEKEITHDKGSLLVNKTYENGRGERVSIPDDVYKELIEGKDEQEIRNIANEEGIEGDKIGISKARHDIIKDKRYTEPQYNFHVPITINRTAPENPKSLNEDVLQLIKENKIEHIIGIDRGERNLIYISVIDLKGNIIEQKSLNVINGIDYREKLANREKKRTDERKDWQRQEQIKDLKQGYLSQVVPMIAKMVIEYNAILVMENMSYGFKTRARGKFEKNVYQQFEKALINKLSYLSSKPDSDNTDSIWQPGGIAKGYQLVAPVDSFKDLQGQKGCIFYVNPWNTSQIDPSTGFMNLFKFPKNTVEFWKDFFGKMKSISYNKDDVCFKFKFRYSDFDDKQCDERIDEWTVCSRGERLYSTKKQGNWVVETLDPTKRIKELLNESGIEYGDGQELIEDVTTKVKDIKSVGWVFKRILDVRNTGSTNNHDYDYILSPVKNSKGEFFDSRKHKIEDKEVCDGDANGAYNIALKGLLLVERWQNEKDPKRIKEKDGKKYFNTSIDYEDWVDWVQDFHQR